MRSTGWEARILFLVALGLVGTLAFDGFWMGFLGLGIGLVALLLEGLFVRLPARELVFIVVGSTTGLVIGLLVILLMRVSRISLAQEGSGADPVILVPVALAYVLAHVTLNKGKKLGLNRIAVFSPNKLCSSIVSSPFKSPKLTCSSTTRPSI